MLASSLLFFNVGVAIVIDDIYLYFIYLFRTTVVHLYNKLTKEEATLDRRGRTRVRPS